MQRRAFLRAREHRASAPFVARVNKGMMMNNRHELREDDLRGGIYRRINYLLKSNRGSRQATGALFGLAGGMLSISLGALLWAVVAALAPGGLRSSLNLLETIFFVLPLPLLALSAYCLDLLETRTPLNPLPATFQSSGFNYRQRLRAQHPHKN